MQVQTIIFCLGFCNCFYLFLIILTFIFMFLWSLSVHRLGCHSFQSTTHDSICMSVLAKHKLLQSMNKTILIIPHMVPQHASKEELLPFHFRNSIHEKRI